MQPLPNLALMLDPIPWVLVDGFAIRAYMPERTTQDVDILIHADDEPAVRTALIVAGYQITGPLPSAASRPNGRVPCRSMC